MDIRMKYDLRWFYSLLLLISYPVFAQDYTVSGFIEDFETGEKLINANIYSSEIQKGTISNNYGFYSITLPARKIRIHYSYVGYKGITREFLLNKDTLINIALETSNLLEEIEVRAHSIQSNVESSRMSINRIPVETIKGLPVLLGEIDIIKTIQLLPGVQSGTEGTSGFYVRGGSPDQNLILLDEVPVYNANHLFGFFSVFNNDAINTVNLTKGAFPARYGGRLSSVLDIRMKEGNKNKIKGSGSVGIISSRLTLDGPVNDKTTFLISGRRTYIDLLAQPFIKYSTRDDYEQFKAGYYFYDFNAKMNHTYSNKSRLYLSTYLGNDKASMTSEETDNAYYNKIKFGLGWGNITTALRWNYLFNNRLFSNTTITFSRYKFKTRVNEAHSFEKNTPVEEFNFTYSSGIKDFAGKIDFDYIPSTNHYIKFGINIIRHTFNPGVTAYCVSGINGSTENVDTTFGNKKIMADEFSAYIEDDLKISSLFKANLGLHFSGFKVENKFYNSLQFRVSARYLLNEKLSVKGAYSKMTQYIHLLTNASVGLPTDLWLPVTGKIKPQKSMQVAFGSVYAITQNIDLSVEGFYKEMDNLIEYKEGASFLTMNEDWQDKIESGKGWAYGAELLLQKKLGKTTGWLGYTLSWSERQFKNLNFGKRFPYKYDRRHDISIVITHRFSDRFDAGLTWVYGTGNAITLPTEKYAGLLSRTYGDYYYPVEYYESRNGFRMASYHRLDLSANFHKQKKWGKRTWRIGVYNAYSRQNPFFLYFDTIFKHGEPKEVLKQVSLFPIIPSISFSFEF
jgi:hypothetical protein